MTIAAASGGISQTAAFLDLNKTKPDTEEEMVPFQIPSVSNNERQNEKSWTDLSTYKNRTFKTKNTSPVS